MKIGSTIVVKMIDADTNTEISESSGRASDFVIPRISEMIEYQWPDGENIIYEVTGVGHKYSSSYRNIITVAVREYKM